MVNKEKLSIFKLVEKISKNEDFCKGILLFTAGYIFCYMFLLDYSQEGMNIFYRWSTTSYSQFQHPVLFAFWCIICSVSIFFNLERMRKKLECPQKFLKVLQYVGAFFLILTFIVPTHHAPHTTFSHYFHYYVHLFSAMFYALANFFCLLSIFIIKMKTDKRYKGWFFGGIIFMAVVAPIFIVRLCGFIETVPMLVAMSVLYMFNYTDIMKPLEKTVAKQKSKQIS